MKYIKKEDPPPSYQKWFDENNLRLLSSNLDEEEIYEKITSKLKKKLRQNLLKEQGHICAYCGKRIGTVSDNTESITFAVDHFEAKSYNRKLTLKYDNFLGTCKMSDAKHDAKHKSTVVDLSTIKSTPKTYANIASELNIDIENFTGQGEKKDDDDLVALGIPSVKYRVIPLHCDDDKEKRLELIGWQKGIESSEKYIINPTKLFDCDLFFEYERDGKIKANTNRSESEQIKTNHTIAICNLDNKYLRKHRSSAYIKAERLLQEFQNDALRAKRNFSEEDIEDKIIDDIYAFEDGKLDPYCFVTAYVFRSNLL